MLKFKRLPLRWQLTLLITLISSVTLAAAFGSYFFLEVLNLREEVQSNYQRTRRLLRAQITLSIKNNPDLAQLGPNEQAEPNRFGLKDLLSKDDTVVGAGVYTPSERLLDSYRVLGEPPIPRPSKPISISDYSADTIFNFET